MPTVIEISNIFSKFNSVKNIYDITSKMFDLNFLTFLKFNFLIKTDICIYIYLTSFLHSIYLTFIKRHVNNLN